MMSSVNSNFKFKICLYMSSISENIFPVCKEAKEYFQIISNMHKKSISFADGKKWNFDIFKHMIEK